MIELNPDICINEENSEYVSICYDRNGIVTGGMLFKIDESKPVNETKVLRTLDVIELVKEVSTEKLLPYADESDKNKLFFSRGWKKFIRKELHIKSKNTSIKIGYNVYRKILWFTSSRPDAVTNYEFKRRYFQ